MEDQGQALGHAAGAELDRRGVGEGVLGVLDGGVEALVGSSGELDLVEERVQGLRLPQDRTQEIECRDVARALPDSAEWLILRYNRR
ncbi:hypothetical protein GCM10009735_38060 [Actinomadura chokoriensis]